MKHASKYDLVIKDLFQRDHPSLLEQLTAGVAVREVLSVELARVEERRADLVLLLADGAILHIEFKSGNDKDMLTAKGSIVCCSARRIGVGCGRWSCMVDRRRCGWKIMWTSATRRPTTRGWTF